MVRDSCYYLLRFHPSPCTSSHYYGNRSVHCTPYPHLQHQPGCSEPADPAARAARQTLPARRPLLVKQPLLSANAFAGHPRGRATAASLSLPDHSRGGSSETSSGRRAPGSSSSISGRRGDGLVDRGTRESSTARELAPRVPPSCELL